MPDAAQTNDLTLNGGTFNSIDFAGSGLQRLAAGTGLQVDGRSVLSARSVAVAGGAIELERLEEEGDI